MFVGVYLDPRRSSTPSKSAESGKYEAFVVVHNCQLQLIQPHILTKKEDRVTIIARFSRDAQLLLAVLQRNTPRSVLLGLKQILA